MMNSPTPTNSEFSLSQVKALQSCLERAATHAEREEWEAAINCYHLHSAGSSTKKIIFLTIRAEEPQNVCL
jgi:hypothetical protein